MGGSHRQLQGIHRRQQPLEQGFRGSVTRALFVALGTAHNRLLTLNRGVAFLTQASSGLLGLQDPTLRLLSLVGRTQRALALTWPVRLRLNRIGL